HAGGAPGYDTDDAVLDHRAPDLAAADAFVREGRLVAAVEPVTGPLA
ncbi:hypothetical protein I3W98_05175, partial [Streptomyces cavourensis]|nr:hypothetical protein [Streptomyces cavourensis]